MPSKLYEMHFHLKSIVGSSTLSKVTKSHHKYELIGIQTVIGFNRTRSNWLSIKSSCMSTDDILLPRSWSRGTMCYRSWRNDLCEVIIPSGLCVTFVLIPFLKQPGHEFIDVIKSLSSFNFLSYSLSTSWLWEWYSELGLSVFCDCLSSARVLIEVQCC